MQGCRKHRSFLKVHIFSDVNLLIIGRLSKVNTGIDVYVMSGKIEVLSKGKYVVLHRITVYSDWRAVLDRLRRLISWENLIIAQTMTISGVQGFLSSV